MRSIKVPMDTPIEFELGDIAAGILKSREDREGEAGTEITEGGQREG